MSVEISGFEDFADELDELQDRVETIDGKNAVSIAELFPPDFMQTYSEFDSIEEFFEESPWTVESEADFGAIPEDSFDAYVADHTGFDSWETMLSAAAREWVGRELAV
jgi:hypothetical protein